ncbi:HVA22-like protein k [Glycine soja]|nr:HVA22-like protein k [Glycine max]
MALPEVVRSDILFVFIITRQAVSVCVLIHTDHMQVGLRLLLSPVTSNLLLRTACCSIGLALPVYSTFKAIENNDPYEQQRIPLYHHMKFAFLVWLQLPTLDGARQMYSSHLQPFLLKHQARMDLIVEFVYGAMSKIISAYKPELELARTLAVKFLMTATQMIRNFIHPVGRELNDIEPQKRQVQDSESEEE